MSAGRDDDRLRRWRLALGDDAAPVLPVELERLDAGRDAALAALYGTGEGEPGRGPGAIQPRVGRRSAGLGRSAPAVARWLGDIRNYFPASVVRVMQQDAMNRLGLRQLLVEPEMLDAVTPDVSLVAALVALNRVIPDQSRDTARAVVRQVTAELERRLAQRTRAAVRGSLQRAARIRRPRTGDIDWDRTIRANLRHYRPEIATIIPERLIGYGRRRRSVERHVILAVDQSASMAESVVYASVFGTVLAGMGALDTSLVVFDTEVVDLTAQLEDPVDILFATQLGGGTDINQAIAYCQGLVTRPEETVLVLISDLMEGGRRDECVARMAALVDSGVVTVALLALNDGGSPAFDHDLAAELAAVGVSAFACTPDLFPDLMAAAMERQDLGRWAAGQGVTTAAPGPP